MSSARHHAEWLSLLEVSGPFLSLPVLLRVFPNELEARDTEQAQELKLAYTDWCERGERDISVHRLWIRYVLERVLGFSPDLLAEGAAIPPGMEAKMAEYGETLRPDHAVVYRAAGAEKPEIALLIQVYPPSQRLDSPVKDRGWKASPDTRMAELLHGAGVPLGLVTNGERWMLVHAPRGETTGFASWYADLWMQEPLVLRSFYSLLNRQRLIGVALGDRLVDLLSESARDQQEVTDQLGYQVRKAVEVFVQSLDRIDQDTNRELLKDVPEKAIYDGALTVMMRLVFLFKAEELGLLLLGDEVYDENYAVSTLREQLRERADQHGEEILERRNDAWCRLLATFRAVYAGTEHDTMRLPPYGGTLLDPDRYPFLEGRRTGTSWRETPAKPLPINNRVVLHLLEALQILRVKVPGGGPAEPRRLSFRSLDIEQIGHVYEGLLDHTARRASQVILGLAGSRDSESEIPLAELEQRSSAGGDRLVEFLGERTGRSSRALEKALATEDLSDNSRLMLSVGGDKKLADRLHPYIGLLREDSFGQWVVIKSGDIFVTSGSDRRSTGTHYTPRSLTEPIVQHTLEPLVYVGPAEGKPKAEWVLKSPKEILALKVCDMALGSGAFLVQSCRYLAERLVEAWEKIEKANVDQVIVTPDGELSAGSPAERLLPVDQAERITIARRFIADRCLYGVDINPMAVEMAKLSLWLITLQRDRPFTFLDHALKCGDSLLGVSSLQQIENFSLSSGGKQITFATINLLRVVEEATLKRLALEDLPSNDHTQIESKNRLHAEVEAATSRVKAIADALIAFELRGLTGSAYDEFRTDEAEKVQSLMTHDADDSLKSQASTGKQLFTHVRKQLRGRCPFHWAVEFPEVFTRGGFDAFVGNPPFVGGQKITAAVGSDYRDYLVEKLAHGLRGSADLCSYFFLRVHMLLRADGGIFGLLATNTIAQGDTREVGLEQLAKQAEIIRAVPSAPWPGTAALEVAHVWASRGKWLGGRILDGESVRGITPFLTALAATSGKPFRLLANEGKSFQGSNVLGMGFMLSPDQAQAIIAGDPDYSAVLAPYLNGDDLNSRPDQSPSRWVINFQDWPLERSAEGTWVKATKEEREAWLRVGRVPADYPDKVAADYPVCLGIVERLVKPERAKNNERNRREIWWRFTRPTLDLYAAIARQPRALVAAQTSKYLSLCFQPVGTVFSHMTVVFALSDFAAFAVLNTSWHSDWILEYCSSLETRLRYLPTDGFETYPFPSQRLDLETVGSRYHELRRKIMLTRQEGLTKTYNRFHDRDEQSADISQLRALHVEIDQAVAVAYGWTSLSLGHGFHTTKQGERYTISESARSTVLDRLLTLNHQLHEEELKAGLHEKGSKAAKKGSRAKSSSSLQIQETLIPDAQRELF